MSKAIEGYGIIYLFCMFVLILFGMLGYAVYYKPISDASCFVVDVIEVHEGLTSDAQVIINQLDQDMTKATIQINPQAMGDYKSYQVKVITSLHLPVLNVDIPLTSSKSTKRCLY